MIRPSVGTIGTLQNIDMIFKRNFDLYNPQWYFNEFRTIAHRTFSIVDFNPISTGRVSTLRLQPVGFGIGLNLKKSKFLCMDLFKPKCRVATPGNQPEITPTQLRLK
jgi:hypothetical protein